MDTTLIDIVSNYDGMKNETCLAHLTHCAALPQMVAIALISKHARHGITSYLAATINNTSHIGLYKVPSPIRS